jgi:hypothetical protein
MRTVLRPLIAVAPLVACAVRCVALVALFGWTYWLRRCDRARGIDPGRWIFPFIWQFFRLSRVHWMDGREPVWSVLCRQPGLPL